MSSHPFDNEFRITPEQRVKFRRDGFVKLEGFLNADVVEALLERIEVEMNRGAPTISRSRNSSPERSMTSRPIKRKSMN